jgi:hypothetical protein
LPNGELVTINAISVQMMIKMPLDLSDSKKRLKVFDNGV